jgi:hypothetical protein
MEKEFVPYQESLELRDLRFDEPCFGAYGAWGFMSSNDVNSLSDEVTQEDLNNKSYTEEDGVCLAPLYQQAFRFFREKFNLEYQIIKSASDSYSAVIHLNTREYLDKILTLYNACVAEVVDCYSYEEVELDCLRKLIEIVKNKSI